jgi:hypothetical protein
VPFCSVSHFSIQVPVVPGTGSRLPVLINSTGNGTHRPENREGLLTIFLIEPFERAKKLFRLLKEPKGLLFYHFCVNFKLGLPRGQVGRFRGSEYARA